MWKTPFPHLLVGALCAVNAAVLLPVCAGAQEQVQVDDPDEVTSQIVPSSLMEEGEGGIAKRDPLVKLEETEQIAPNLTVSFRLNSTLGPEATKYYSEVVEELLRHLPRKVEIRDPKRAKVFRKPEFQNMKVVAYLPTYGTEDVTIAPEKKIRFFDVMFEVPENLTAMRDQQKTDDSGVAPSIFVHGGNYDDFLTTLGEEYEAPADDVAPEEGVENLEALDDGSFSRELARIVQTGRVDAPKKDGGMTHTDLAPQSVARKLLPATPVKKAPSQPNKPTAKPGKLVADVTYAGGAYRVESQKESMALSLLAEGIRTHNVGRLRFVILTPQNTAGDANALVLKRLGELKRVMAEKGVDLEGYDMSIVKAQTSGNASISLEAISVN